MADIAMSAFTPATNGEYIYGEAADGSQVKISKSDFATVLAEYLPLNSVATKVNVERLYVWNIPTKKNGTVIGEVITLLQSGALENRAFTYISTNYNVVVSFDNGIPKGTIALAFYSIVS